MRSTTDGTESTTDTNEKTGCVFVFAMRAVFVTGLCVGCHFRGNCDRVANPLHIIAFPLFSHTKRHPKTDPLPTHTYQYILYFYPFPVLSSSHFLSRLFLGSLPNLFPVYRWNIGLSVSPWQHTLRLCKQVSV